jgi:NADH-quinone oxidoreductase subunit L
MDLVREFGDHPGLYFVTATLVPLASFTLLLLVGGARKAFRAWKNTPLGGRLFEMTGTEQQNRGAAYVATGAIALAFLLSMIGGIKYFQEEGQLEAGHHASATGHGHDHGHSHGAKEEKGNEEKHDEHADAHKRFDERWSGQLTFAELRFLPTAQAGTAGLPHKGTRLTLGYKIDALTVIMFMMVTLIATLIHVFSAGYMAEELQATVEDHQVHTDHGHFHRRGRFGRFFLFLSLFCFSMLNLILADNLFQVFLSWELVGVCSYLLIGFYYERQSASNAANKAFITNRVGDMGFIIGVLILWSFVGTLNFDSLFKQIRSPMTDAHGHRLQRAGQVVRAETVRTNTDDSVRLRVLPPGLGGSEVVLFPRQPEMDEHAKGHFHGLDTDKEVTAYTNPTDNQFGTMPYWLLITAGLGIFLGCVGKSAQFPLHVWLPDAMEGPTPVSALIHAATMVAAGVYLVGRCFPLFVPESRLVIAYTGGITLFMAATIAIVMTDIKKVLAYSTVSQLGYMMLALGVGGWVGGIFHLLTHAFFKALLFLCSGAVIYGCHHEQDMSKMGGLYPKMRITALTMLVGVLTIAGTPLFSGWYSKDMILADAFGFAYVHREHMLLFILPLITAGITAFYMFRMWFMTFTGEPKDHHVYEHAHEPPKPMTVPLIILAIFSICVAWGWPVWDSHKSHLYGRLHHQMAAGATSSVIADFGGLEEEGPHWAGGDFMQWDVSERHWAHEFSWLAELLALGAGLLGILFASLLYYFKVLDPAEAKESLPGLHRFLERKWYFDEAYSVLLVRPALVVAYWFRNFDLKVIDGAIHGVAWICTRFAFWEGRVVDAGIVDGLVNLTARVVYSVGSRLRTVQTGYLRSYVLFLVLAVVGIFAVLTYFVRLALAG